MFVFVLIGIVFLGFSAMFLFAPGLIIKMSELGNKLIFTDYSPVAHRKVSAVVLFLMSIVMLYLGIKL
jgi:hypothetical protein